METPTTAPSAVIGRNRNRGRRGVAIVMAASLALSSLTRLWADHARTAALPATGEQAASTASLSSMNSFALGLLLGGLRGPLVMILWTDSENQKTEKNLEGVDTEIEWIRLLQPEFDTVHLFQIWNKAYNISVQMASLANKYDTILGALDYAHNVDGQKPKDINIIGAIGQLYFDKLGTSSEKVYYRRRVREETKPHVVEGAARRSDIGWRRVQLDPILDDQFNVPTLLAGTKDHQGDLFYLADPEHPYGPYTDGVSTFALAFNYYKRCEQLMNKDHQHHDQLSDVVVDSRPALSLKNWADEEMDRARLREAQGFGAAPEKDDDASALLADATNPDAVTAGIPLTQPVIDPAKIRLAISAYDRVTRLVNHALDEYKRHIQNFPDRESQYRLYMAELTALGKVAAADRDFLNAMIAPPGSERDRLPVDAGDAYGPAMVDYQIILLQYYTDSRILAQALPPGYSPQPRVGQKSIEELPPELVVRADAIAERAYPPQANEDPNGDRWEYIRHIRRAIVRLKILQASEHKGSPTTAP